MSSLSLAARDSATMLRRNLRRAQRYPALTFSMLMMPLVFLLLFVYVFGGALGVGIGGDGRGDYLAYVVPGILLMATAAAPAGIAISVNIDMTEGIVARFRTMAVARSSVLTGHVVGTLLQTLLCLVLLAGVALLMGYRPTGDALGYLGAAGLLTVLTFALTWLGVALGLFAKTPENASNLPLILTLLPFLGSGFVPPESMPGGMAWFAEHQPFTPMIETLRGLLTGGPVGSSAVTAMVWCGVIALGGYLWSRKLYARDPRPTAP